MPKHLPICLLVATLTTLAPAIEAAENSDPSMGTKLGAGLSNIFLGFIEMPKNVINTSNEANVALGISGGVIKGGLHTVGRVLAGTLDVLSFPLPTESILAPQYVWENFNVETHYNSMFKTKK
ncbi:MAG: exosortase system-associated protein, TIGR04073 family [Methylococcaceae bacterium]|nr:exosortase system-associated protein, TIGR04073 family [Methylococcaceae bacterium]